MGDTAFALVGTDPISVLRLMRERDDWYDFAAKIGFVNVQPSKKKKVFVDSDYLFDSTGKIRDVAIKFLERKKELNV